MIKEATKRPRWNRDRLRDEATKGAPSPFQGEGWGEGRVYDVRCGSPSPKPSPSRERASERRGFTLLEIVVVISLVLFLLGLTLAVGVNVIERSEISRTRNTMRLLDMALQEWEIAADRKLSWGDGAIYDLQGDPADGYGPSGTDDIFIISELLDTVARPSQVKDIIANIDAEFVRQYAQYAADESPPWLVGTVPVEWIESLVILDAWGAPIYPTHPGPLWKNSASLLDPDDDGTMRILNETEYGIAVNRQVFFVSAGPDGKFGVTSEFGTGNYEDKREARADNIYSYQPIRPPEWDE